MTRPLSAALQAHIAGETTTLAFLWKITRRDGVVMGFTDYSQSLVYDGVTYEANSGFAPTTIANKGDLSVDNMDVEGILDSSAITEDDIAAGVYDYAAVEIRAVNYADEGDGDVILLSGTLGRIATKRGKFMAEIRSISQRLSQKIGRLYLPSCDAVFGDARCGANAASFTESDTVASAASNRVFTAAGLLPVNGYYTGGEVTWTGGGNVGLRMEVKAYADGEIELVLPMPQAITAGDAFDIVAGCDKRDATCRAKFNNLVNFRGFPTIPGTDAIFKTAGTFK